MVSSKMFRSCVVIRREKWRCEMKRSVVLIGALTSVMLSFAEQTNTSVSVTFEDFDAGNLK
jgi:phenylpyruvate tautomerase PptA (4-oxalocrotonate tautomerase family)